MIISVKIRLISKVQYNLQSHLFDENYLFHASKLKGLKWYWYIQASYSRFIDSGTKPKHTRKKKEFSEIVVAEY